MKEFEGTEGDWFLGEGFSKEDRRNNTYNVYALNNDLEIIAKIPRDTALVNGRKQNHEANARLISAAPQILYSLQRLWNDLRNAKEELGEDTINLLNKTYRIDESINKAIGHE